MINANKRPSLALSKLGITSLTLGWLFVILTSFQEISYKKINLSDSLSAYLLEVDPQQYKIIPVHANDQAIGRQTVEELARKHQALAAVNGGFFKSKPWEGLPAGILKINGKWFAWPTKPRGAIGWSDEGTSVLIDRLLCSGNLIVNQKIFPIHGINCPRADSEIIIFFPHFHKTTLTSSKGLEVIIRQNRLITIEEGGNSAIPPDGYVISYGSRQSMEFWKTIPRGTTIDLNLSTHPQLSPHLTWQWNLFPHLVGGTPVLVHQGEVIFDFSPEKTLNRFINQPYARTAVGLLPNGHWLFVVVDSPHKLFSSKQGMTIPELARFMADLGCVEALNLDGGGSSTMVVNNRVVNTPSGDEDESLGVQIMRPVSDAILIKARP